MSDEPGGGVGGRLVVLDSRAFSVVVQRVPARLVDVFLEWQRGITDAAAGFSGYRVTEAYPPFAEGEEAWVVIIHFDDTKGLQEWLDSGVRAQWMARLPVELREFEVKSPEAGFGSWFAGVVDKGVPLAHWKVFLAVLAGLYPTVMLLTMFLSPHTARFGLAASMLVGNAASVAFLEWLGMPVISRLLGGWLKPGGKEGRGLDLWVGVGLVCWLVVMAVVFGRVMG